MKFTWGPGKAALNLKDHSVTFAEALWRTGYLRKRGSVFWPRLKQILDRADETYNLFSEAPPN